MDDIQSKIEQMRGLIATIKQADIAYFRDDHPTMSDRDYGCSGCLAEKAGRENRRHSL